MLPLAHARAWLIASLLLVAGVIYASLATIDLPPAPVAWFDKLEHACAYALLAVWFTGLVARRHYTWVVLGLAALGLALEFLQHAMQRGRTGDPWDMVANMLGITVGVALGTWLTGGWALKVEAWLRRS